MRRAWISITLLAIITACSSQDKASQASVSESTAPKAKGGPAIVLPDLTLRDQSGKERALRSFLGAPLVLYFYPKDDTPGCTIEATSFRDHAQAFTDVGAHVVGVSTDDTDSHRSFADSYQLEFPLLADEDSKLADILGVPVRLGFAARQTFVFSKDGQLLRHFESVDPKTHVAEVLDFLKRNRDQ